MLIYKAERSNQIIFKRGFLQKLEEAEEKLSSTLEKGYREDTHSNYSVYTGLTGLVFLELLRYENCANYDKKRLQSMVPLISPSGSKSNISFLNGDSGLLSLKGLVYLKLGNQDVARECFEKLIQMADGRRVESESTPNEILYGRAGYLYALLFVKPYIFDSLSKGYDTAVRKVINIILNEGKRLSLERKHKAPLMYEWHDKEYYGAAHGYSGILYILLTASKYLTPDDHKLIRPTLDFILSAKLPLNNFPSSGSNHRDVYVQWCHGAPGFVDLFCRAYQVYNDARYLHAAIDCGEVTWKRGILQKGYSLCHGVAGNGYAFLTLYQITKDPKYVHRAGQFAKWCFTYGRNNQRRPDRPFSLYEGIAGVIYFLEDLKNPQKAAFPGFSLKMVD